ncbi:hypothetical protein RDE2_41610 [Rhodococcus sp. RDE2]|nr:hypothetical protein RDE2_41610 [Rhodococcus sp. RDE2]
MIPEGIVTSNFPRVYRRLQDVGVSFDRWQEGFGQIALGCNAAGKYAASVGGVVASIPRQVGKTYTVGNLIIGMCLEFPGLRVIWTSHHNRTTTNTFRSMQSMVRKKKIWPYVAAIRTANGEQEIVFTNGSIIMFGAREQGFGRGMEAIDVEVFDEAQILGVKALEDMVPATNAAKNPHGGLLFFIGTPPRPTDDGESFTKKRKKALAGLTDGQVYVEISADPDTDPDDQSKFGTFNPSYPHRTPLESMLRMRENIPDDEAWRREAMGIWPDDDDQGPPTWQLVTELQWHGLVDFPELAGTIGVGIARVGSRWVIAGAQRTLDDRIHVEVGYMRTATNPEIVDLIGRIDDVLEPCAIATDSRSPAAVLEPMMKTAGIELIKSTTNQAALMSQGFVDDAEDGLISHTGQRELGYALEHAAKRSLPRGDWVVDAGGDPEVAPMLAVIIARWALITFESRVAGASAAPTFERTNHTGGPVDSFDPLTAAF